MSASESHAPIPLGPFVLQRPIGEGGMGIVWQGLHPMTGVRVAVKVLRSERAWDQRQVELFGNEVRAVAELDHPGIVMVLDHGTIDEEAAALSQGKLVPGSPYLAMELASGGTLFQHVGRLSWDELHDILDGTLNALGHAHARGVIHRDIKPSNIIRSAASDLRPGPKITDFGIAQLRVNPQEEIVEDANFAGSPSYISPEQFQARHHDVGPWSDLYSVGCTFWASSTGDTPYHAKKLADMLEFHVRGDLPPYIPIVEVPEGFEQWLRKLLQPRIKKRFQSAADAIHALNELAGRPRLQAQRHQRSDREDDTTTLTEPSPLQEIPILLTAGSPEETTAGPPVNRPPVPADWRDPQAVSAPVRLLGAGLGLYGLRRVPLIGRDDERSQLWARLRSISASKRSSAIVLRGPSGYGKSRLAQWLCERGEEVGAARSLRCVHGPIPAPPHGIGPMLARLLRSYGLTREEILIRARRRLRQLGWTRHYLWNALTELISPTDDVDSSQPAYRFPSPEERYVIAATFLELESCQRPLILWMDDVQWGGDAIALARHVVERGEDTNLPILVVLTVRDDELLAGSFEAEQLDALSTLDSVLDIRLDALALPESGQLVGELLGLETDLASEVVERAEGNPLFAIQLVGDWVARGVLQPGTRGFGLAQGASVSIPDDIHAVWADRFNRILQSHPETARISLEVAAALGPFVDWSEWRGVCKRAKATAPPSLLESLASQGLVRPDPHGWTFGHGMARESLARQAQEAGRWGHLHSACADYLNGKRGHRVRERIGLHLMETQRHDEAVESLLAGAKERIEAAEFAAATRLLDARKRVLDRQDVAQDDEQRAAGWIARSTLLRLQGRLEEGLEQTQQVMDIARDKDWTTVLAAVLLEHGSALLARGRLREAAIHLESARANYSRMKDEDGLAESSVTLGYALRDLGELDAAAKAFQQGVELRGGGDLSPRLPASLMGLADVRIAQGEYEQAQEGLLRAVALLEQSGQLLGLARGWLMLSLLLSLRGELEEAAVLAARARELRERFGNPSETATCCNQQGEILRRQGKLAAAEEAYATAIRLYESSGSPWSFMPRVNLALVRMEQDRHELSRKGLEAAWLEVRKAGRAAVAQHIDALLLPCYGRTGNWVAWDERMDRIRDFSEGLTLVDADSAACLERAADLAGAQGQDERAAEARELAGAHRRALGSQTAS